MGAWPRVFLSVELALPEPQEISDAIGVFVASSHDGIAGYFIVQTLDADRQCPVIAKMVSRVGMLADRALPLQE